MRQSLLILLKSAGIFRYAWTVVAAGLIVSMVAPVSVANGEELEASANQSSMAVVFRDGLVSVDTRDVRLVDLLRTIAEKANFELSVLDSVEQTVTRTFSDVPLGEAVHDLTRGVSSILIFGADGATLQEVLVLSSREEPNVHAAPIADDSLAREQADWRQDARGLILVSNELSVDELTSFVSVEEDPVVRTMAVMALSRFRSDQAKEGLVDALYDDDSFVRSEAIVVLGRFWGADAVEPLSDVAFAHPDQDTRSRASVMLQTIPRLESLRGRTLPE